MKKFIFLAIALLLIIGTVIGVSTCKKEEAVTPSTPAEYTINVTVPDSVSVTLKRYNEENFKTLEDVFTVFEGDLIQIENAPQFTFSAIENEQYTLLVGLEATDVDNVFKVTSNVRIYVSLYEG